ncbi:hypothetical protein Q664_29390 [Archangium violaceum Cb vi76]|uniref:DUF4258 domain-containing protein n=1 Tax=Archangium violaceum Cb vi76 TaxID=1406225 RepID=A0A084SPE2_9BACT|nr:hypothetical protein Q664_29390 [Archangium violaceum Cb vi76]
MSPQPLSEGYSLSQHAQQRMRMRGIPLEAVCAALWYGRVVRTRDAEFYVIGHQEIRRYAHEGIDLTAYEGVHVVCTDEGHILTVYRNRDLSHLRPRRYRSHWHHRGQR